MENGQSAAMVAVGVSTKLMFQHVALEVGLLATLQASVLGEGRITNLEVVFYQSRLYEPLAHLSGGRGR